MNVAQLVVVTMACLFTQQPVGECVNMSLSLPQVKGAQSQTIPVKSGESLDVELTAKAAHVWDVETGAALYEKEPDTWRPVASLNKLASALAARSLLKPEQVIEIPAEVRGPQRLGAHIRLPVGEHVSVEQLLQAGLVASANDAMVALAVTALDSEEAFVEYANSYLMQRGFENTRLANATGFGGGNQHATAREVGQLLQMAYEDPVLRPFLSMKEGVLVTQEGTRREYDTTNDLLGTYLPILAAKTGYTLEAGENLAILTEGDGGQRIGAVVLGSDHRFFDMQVLVEWVWRNWTWPH